MDPSPLHTSFLRPPILHILRAAGFTTTRPSVLDTLVDLTSRYLTLLATNTARHAALREPSNVPFTITLTDVRLALQDAGAFYPSSSEMEEQVRGEEDMRGVNDFIAWCQGETNREIRRIAGMAVETSSSLANASIDPSNPEAAVAAAEAATLEQEEANADFLTRLKRKHAKTKDGEESRYAGTVLGKDREEGEIKIEGWEIASLEGWGRMLREKYESKEEVAEVEGRSGSESDSPLSEISGDTAMGDASSVHG